jgi:Fe2+ or Zn2+ uptake regulation protein
MPELENTPEGRHEHRVVVMCSECGELIEVKDVAAMILALHLQNDCAASSLLTPRQP